MATTTSITSNYAGEAAKGYIAAALLSPVTVDLVTKHPNVKYKLNIKNYSQTLVLDDESCDFEASGTVTITESVLEPKCLQVNKQFCKTDFRSSWDAAQMGFSAFDELPTDFASFLIEYHIAQLAESIEQIIWTGESSTTGEFEGFLGNFNAIDITGTTLTAANIIAQLQLVENAVPDAVYSQPDLVYYMGTAAGKYYVTAQAALGYMDKFHVGKTELNFHGIPIVICPGMPANTILAAQAKNLHFGFGLENDTNEVRLLDMAELDGSQNARLIMRFCASTQITNEGDMVYYTTV